MRVLITIDPEDSQDDFARDDAELWVRHHACDLWRLHEDNDSDGREALTFGFGDHLGAIDFDLRAEAAERRGRLDWCAPGSSWTGPSSPGPSTIGRNLARGRVSSANHLAATSHTPSETQRGRQRSATRRRHDPTTGQDADDRSAAHSGDGVRPIVGHRGAARNRRHLRRRPPTALRGLYDLAPERRRLPLDVPRRRVRVVSADPGAPLVDRAAGLDRPGRRAAATRRSSSSAIPASRARRRTPCCEGAGPG